VRRKIKTKLLLTECVDMPALYQKII